LINTSTGETTLTRKRYRWDDDTNVSEIFPWGKGFDSFGLGQKRIKNSCQNVSEVFGLMKGDRIT